MLPFLFVIIVPIPDRDFWFPFLLWFGCCTCGFNSHLWYQFVFVTFVLDRSCGSARIRDFFFSLAVLQPSLFHFRNASSKFSLFHWDRVAWPFTDSVFIIYSYFLMY